MRRARGRPLPPSWWSSTVSSIPPSSVSSSGKDRCRPAFGVAAHQMRDGQREDAVEDLDADLGVGPVPLRAEGDHVGVLHPSESGLDLVLRPVGGDHLDGSPGVTVGEQDPLAGQFCVPDVLRSRVLVRQVRRRSAGCSPVRVTVMTSATQRVLRMSAISASTAVRARRVRARASFTPARAAWPGPWTGSGRTRATALRANVGEWVRTARRLTPNAVTVASTGQSRVADGIHRHVQRAGDGEQVRVVAGGKRPDEPEPGGLDHTMLSAEFCPAS